MYRTVVLFLLAACGEPATVGPAPVERPSLGASKFPVVARVAPASAPARARPATDAATVRVLLEGLTSDDYATRLVATEALGCAPAAVALPPLERQLGDPEEDVRAAAVLALKRHGNGPARALLASVRDDTQETASLRVLAAAALISPSNPCD
jgi:HEAT repeat protein